MQELEENIDELEIEDETLAERLWGLTEMFPEPVRNLSYKAFTGSLSLSHNFYKWSRTGLWVAASTFTILILPIMLENERSNVEEQQQLQQRELLLGPSAAYSSPSHAQMMPPVGFTLQK